MTVINERDMVPILSAFCFETTLREVWRSKQRSSTYWLSDAPASASANIPRIERVSSDPFPTRGSKPLR